jgi:Nuclease-related domain
MASIEIFIGAPVEHESERATLRRAVEYLSAQGISAVVLANILLDRRQIDLVIALDPGVLVVESKQLSAPVRGGQNGDWQVRLASGVWKNAPNAYAQTLGEALALRDTMSAFVGADVPYLNAALVFVPALPAGSSVPASDFKVVVGSLDDLPKMIAVTKRRGWSLDLWRRFAAQHRLTRVGSVESAVSEHLLAAEHLLRDYGEAFTQTYGRAASEFVAVHCVGEDGEISSDAVIERTAADGNVLLAGPSGCGKSLLSYKISLAAFGHGQVPIIVPAKDFEGSLRDIVNREAGLLDAHSVAELIGAARKLGRPLLLVVDGYNECTPSERARLTRSIAAAVKRFNARIVVTSRIALERDDLVPAQAYRVRAPHIDTKLAIAQAAAGAHLMDRFVELLRSVGSCLEAKMVGELGLQLPAGTSKYGLFDAFVRQRLGDEASDGIRALTRIAAMMTERISFGLSVRELDRLSDREALSGALLNTLQRTSLLAIRGDRVSFSHEMFLNVFAAEAIIRRAGNSPDAVVSALRLPQHLEMKPFVLGAIDDDSFRRQVLFQMADARVIRACLEGQCGPDAQCWANERCDEVLARVATEIDTLRFKSEPDDFWHMESEPGTLQAWSDRDVAVLAAIPHELIAGRRLDQVLALVRQMDGRMRDELLRLSAIIPRRTKSLRSGLYAACLAGFGRNETGLSKICGPICRGHLYDGPKLAAACDVPGRLQSEGLTASEIGLLVELYKYADHNGPSIGPMLARILDCHWADAPHHLQLNLMHAAAMSRHGLTEDGRNTLIETIERLLPADGGVDLTGMIDALKYLGALDDDQDAHVATAKEEIRAALADCENPLMWEHAAGLWNSQFDHPYDGAYCEAWNDLPGKDRKALLLMAARSSERCSMFTPSLIGELASFADPAIGPAIARWTHLPSQKHVFAGEGIRAFEIAHAALARLRRPLPVCAEGELAPAAEALLACGELLYWLNRDDLALADRRARCARALRVLLNHEAGVSAAAVGEFSRPDMLFSESARRLPGMEPIVTSLGQHFPHEIAAIYRNALKTPTKQSGYFDFFRIDDVVEKGIAALGQFGETSDIPLLRALSHHPSFSRPAVQAIKELEEQQWREETARSRVQSGTFE